jgi:WD40 repeat protein
MLLATASRDSDIRLYVVSYEGSKVLSTKPLITLTEAHQGPVNSIAMDEKDRQCRLISGGSDEQLRLWDICCTGDIFDESPCSDSSCNSKPGERKKSIFSYEGEIRSIAISKDHEQIAAAFDQCVFHTRHEKEGDASSVFLGNNDCRKNWRVLKGHSSNIRCIEFSPDGKLIATACSDGSIRLWKVGAGTYIRKWKAHNGFMVCSLAFSVDGRRLLSAGSDGTVAIEVI